MNDRQKPNLLIITTDQQRWDTLGCYGNRLIQTPNLDRLASQGIVFNRAYCESPICIPSRITMLTGKKTAHHGATLHNSNMRLDERTLADVLSENGYVTHFIGKAHFKSQEARGTEESLPDWRDGKFEGWNGPYAGFQAVDLILGHSNSLVGHYGQWLRNEHASEFAHFFAENMQPLEVSCGQGVYRNTIPPELHSSHYAADRTIEFLEKASRSKQPFFCFTSFPDPHWPICPPSPYFDMYEELEIPVQIRFPNDLGNYPRQFHRLARGEGTGYDGGGHLVADPGDIAKITRPYWGAVSFIDDNVGRILNGLEALNLTENTIILFTSDHGEHMGAHGLMAKGGFCYEEFIRCPLILHYQGQVQAAARNDALFSFVDIVPTLLELMKIDAPDLAPDGISQSAVLKGETHHLRECLTVTHFSQRSSSKTPDIHTLITDDWKLNYYAGDPKGELYHLSEDPQEVLNLYRHPNYLERQQSLIQTLLNELILVNDKRPHLERTKIEPGYADHCMRYSFWRPEFDKLTKAITPGKTP
jgi:arylsulfatase A-like enzyme